MGKRARQAFEAKQRRRARQGAPPTLPRDLGHLYGKRGGVQDEDESWTFDMGEILWALGTGKITGEPAEIAGAAWLANIMQNREDPFTLAREVAALGLEPRAAYDIAHTPITAEELPRIAKELIDAGLLPPPPGSR